MSEPKAEDVAIGKFDILATYTYTRAVLDGMDDAEAKVRGMVAAIMGAQARLGRRLGHEEFRAEKDRAEKKKKTKITPASFDHQVSEKMGKFFQDVFVPLITKLVEAGFSYEDVKRAVRMPSTWGTKISGQQFREKAESALADSR
jgi:DNA invertase Pin-like site-specific DNA recombinase